MFPRCLSSQKLKAALKQNTQPGVLTEQTVPSRGSTSTQASPVALTPAASPANSTGTASGKYKPRHKFLPCVVLETLELLSDA